MNRRKKVCIFDIVLLVVVAAALGVSMLWSRDIEMSLGLLYYVEAGSVDEKDIVAEQTASGIYVSAAETDSALSVHFVDVGQGDCAIIEFPDGKTMVIDGGENNKATEAAIETFIDNTFDESFKYFDYAILTHPDSDHCGSLDYVLNNYPARVVYRPNVEAVGTNSNPYVDPGKADLTADAATKNTAVYANAVKAMYAPTAAHDFTPEVVITDPADPDQSITGGEGDGAYTFDFFSPLSSKYTGEGDWNNYSPIMILTYRGFRFAMSGDAEEKNLGEFVDRVNAAKTDGVTDKYDMFDDSFCVDVIKAGHHGSENATTVEYLEVMTSPSRVGSTYCVISCGEGNKYGHPHAAALERYKNIGVADENILRTDKAGDINFSVRVGEDGVYNLFYGDKSTPSTPEPEPEPTPEPKMVLVYRELGGIKLTWAAVAWSCYAVLVLAAIVHIIFADKKIERGDGKRTRSRRR